GIETLDRFTREILEERRRGNRRSEEPDLMDALLKAQDDGLTEQELVDLYIAVLVGGYDTSKNLLTLIMNQLMDRPEDYARCAEDFGFCRKVVEEMLRFRGVSTAMRETTEDIVYRDVSIPTGTMLFFALPVAARDPRVIPDPDTFDPERDQNARHM